MAECNPSETLIQGEIDAWRSACARRAYSFSAFDDPSDTPNSKSNSLPTRFAADPFRCSGTFGGPSAAPGRDSDLDMLAAQPVPNATGPDDYLIRPGAGRPPLVEWLPSAAASASFDGRYYPARSSLAVRRRKLSPMRNSPSTQGGTKMLYWSIFFLVLALVSAVFGFTRIAADSAWIAKILFVVFLVMLCVSFVFGVLGDASRGDLIQ